MSSRHDERLKRVKAVRQNLDLLLRKALPDVRFYPNENLYKNKDFIIEKSGFYWCKKSNECGNFYQLIAKVLNIKNIKELRLWLDMNLQEISCKNWDWLRVI